MKRFIVLIFVVHIVSEIQLYCQSDSMLLLEKYNLKSVGVVILKDSTKIGTGSIVIDSNIVLSAGHVERNNPGIKFFQLLLDTVQYRLELIKIDTLRDLVLYKVLGGFRCKPLKVDTSNFLNYNDAVLYFGYDTRYNSTNKSKMIYGFSVATNNTKARKFKTKRSKTDFHEIQADCFEIQADMIPGYSGCPVFTIDGDLIGIVSQGDTSDLKKIYVFTVQPIIEWYKNTKSIK